MNIKESDSISAEIRRESPAQEQVGLSVVIAHYAPSGTAVDYRALLLQTIGSVRIQQTPFPIEIVVCDDGSAWSKDLCSTQDVTCYDRRVKPVPHLLDDLDVDRYLVFPDVGLYRGVQLKQSAILGSLYPKIVVLDDDHPFLRVDSLRRYFEYLDRFAYVRGRVIGPRGLPQLFLSRNAQGTNYGIRKELFEHFDGFGKYLWNNGYGEDNDLLLRIYRTMKMIPSFRACFAGEIVTRDLASNRWLARSAAGESETAKNLHLIPHERYQGFVHDFQRAYGVHPYSRNASRNKCGWVVIPSIASLLSELKYVPLFIMYYPAEQFLRLKAVWSRGGAVLLFRKIWSRLIRRNKI